MENHRDRAEVREALGGGRGRRTGFSTTLAEERMYVAIPLRRGDAVAAAIRTSFSVQTLAQTLRAVYWRIAAAALVAAVFVAVASLLVARAIVRPLETIRSGAERFSRGELKHRLPALAPQSPACRSIPERDGGTVGPAVEQVVRQQNEHRECWQA